MNQSQLEKRGLRITVRSIASPTTVDGTAVAVTNPPAYAADVVTTKGAVIATAIASSEPDAARLVSELALDIERDDAKLIRETDMRVYYDGTQPGDARHVQVLRSDGSCRSGAVDRDYRKAATRAIRIALDPDS